MDLSNVLTIKEIVCGGGVYRDSCTKFLREDMGRHIL